MEPETLIRSYYAAYNSEDETLLLPLLSEDVVLCSAAGEQRGREAYMATYRWMVAQFVDRMTPQRIVVEPDGVCVDILDQLTARHDVADFLGMSLKSGQVIELALTGRYRLLAGRIVHIDIAARG